VSALRVSSVVYLTLCVLCHNTDTTTTLTEKTVMANTNLEDVPSVDLMTELLRRLKCSSKPDKRLILVDPIIRNKTCVQKFDAGIKT
ncbi:adenylate kinase B, partial [Trifolium medium]|nr:adenylate kinase B [Trifolium medium]